MDFDFGFDFDLDGFLSLEGFFLGVGGADLAEEGLAEPGLAERWSSAKQKLSQIQFHIISVHIKHMVMWSFKLPVRQLPVGKVSPNWDPSTLRHRFF